MKSGIYQIEINKKCYIGSATNLYNRKHRHLHDLKNNKHCNKKLQNAFNKYGINSLNYSVIEYVEIDNLIQKEQFYIDKCEPFYNICKIAGNTQGYLHSEKIKIHLSKMRKGKQNSLGRVLTDETKNIISEKAKQRGLHKNFIEASIRANTGRKHTEENVMKRVLKQIKLTHQQVKEVRKLLSEKEKQIDIAKRYNVTQRVISKIKNNIGIYANF